MSLPSAHPPYRFGHPEPERRTDAVFPVFLPFAGCPGRCLYCAQDAQTGQNPAPVAALLATAEKEFAAQAHPPEELAFYGGTFTALPEADLRLCLDFAGGLLRAGRIRRFRCSTRPDAVTPTLLERLKRAGCTLVELGVQSFSDTALAASGRGYDGALAARACRMVVEAGLDLVIQLMPGLPGRTPENMREDIATAAALRPICARIYPCVVFAGSPLARLWEAGRYAPLALDEAVELSAHACLVFWRSGTRVIRMGLADPERLRERVVAGPLHSAFGNLARIRALFLLVREEATRMRRGLDTPLVLRVPRARQGEAFGPAGSSLAPYADIGISRVETHDEPDFWLLPA